MPEVHYKQFTGDLKAAAGKDGGPGIAGVVLIHGEEYLCKSAFDMLVKTLLPEPAGKLNCEFVDGTDDGLVDGLQRVNTYSLVPGKKVVAVLDCQIFQSKNDVRSILGVAKGALDKDNLKKAARTILHLLVLKHASLEDVGRPGGGRAWAADLGQPSAGEWIETVLRYCREQQLALPKITGSDTMLQEAVGKGFPTNNHLILTADIVDKRRRLYKTILDQGMVVDCSVPRGDRKADKAAQTSVLVERMDAALRKAGKTADRGTFQAMADMTGFNLRTFLNNLDKLISYIGDRNNITPSDVEKVLKRSKKDPIYAFTNAVTDRHLDGALFYMHSLLADPDFGHPLQLLGAVINQIRKLLVIKDFVESRAGRVWYTGCAYADFQHRVIPAVQDHDRQLTELLSRWEQTLAAPENGGGTSKKAKKKKNSPSTDLFIAKNPKNAYPVYQMFRKSERFSKKELVGIVDALVRADHRLKTTGQDPKRILERVLFVICDRMRL